MKSIICWKKSMLYQCLLAGATSCTISFSISNGWAQHTEWYQFRSLRQFHRLIIKVQSADTWLLLLVEERSRRTLYQAQIKALGILRVRCVRWERERERERERQKKTEATSHTCTFPWPKFALFVPLLSHDHRWGAEGKGFSFDLFQILGETLLTPNLFFGVVNLLFLD